MKPLSQELEIYFFTAYTARIISVLALFHQWYNPLLWFYYCCTFIRLLLLENRVQWIPVWVCESVTVLTLFVTVDKSLSADDVCLFTVVVIFAPVVVSAFCCVATYAIWLIVLFIKICLLIHAKEYVNVECISNDVNQYYRSRYSLLDSICTVVLVLQPLLFSPVLLLLHKRVQWIPVWVCDCADFICDRWQVTVSWWCLLIHCSRQLCFSSCLCILSLYTTLDFISIVICSLIQLVFLLLSCYLTYFSSDIA